MDLTKLTQNLEAKTLDPFLKICPFSAQLSLCFLLAGHFPASFAFTTGRSTSF